MTNKSNNIASKTINAQEIENFTRIADQWWDPKGKFAPLHKFNPIRLEYILTMIYSVFERNKTALKPLEGLRVLDIGCGGGLLCEPLARLGAEVVGIDAAVKNIEVAKIHAKKTNLTIDYRAISLESLVEEHEKFDIVLNMEVIEHVENPKDFILSTMQSVRHDGLLFIATLNRTFKSLLLAIIGAEYVLQWLPKGTHNIKKFIKPLELKQYFLHSDFSFICSQF